MGAGKPNNQSSSLNEISLLSSEQFDNQPRQAIGLVAAHIAEIEPKAWLRLFQARDAFTKYSQVMAIIERERIAASVETDRMADRHIDMLVRLGHGVRPFGGGFIAFYEHGRVIREEDRPIYQDMIDQYKELSASAKFFEETYLTIQRATHQLVVWALDHLNDECLRFGVNERAISFREQIPPAVIELVNVVSIRARIVPLSPVLPSGNETADSSGTKLPTTTSPQVGLLESKQLPERVGSALKKRPRQAKDGDGPIVNPMGFSWRGQDVELNATQLAFITAIWESDDCTIDTIDLAVEVFDDEEKVDKLANLRFQVNRVFQKAKPAIPLGITVYRAGKSWISFPPEPS
jgi:hypothetical protein